MPYEFKTTRKIEFADTDLAGIVHFARFFVFMETAEHEFLRSLGTSVSTVLDGDKIGWPRLSASCEYLSPLKFEDLVEIHLKVVRKGTKSLTYSFVFTRDGDLIARGQMTSACCICNPGEPLTAIPIPKSLAEQIEQAPGDELASR
ncbi:MAG: acyl-CoA thioesterase [Calditrichaeota bacterium]|nr:MAG: acyl-CoA thioesterase [Calditrichota bacterium]